jgi:hypothetical protein
MPSRNRSPTHDLHGMVAEETRGGPHRSSDDPSNRTLLRILTVTLFGVIWICLRLSVKAGFVPDPGTLALLGAAIVATGAFHLCAGMAAVRVTPCPGSPPPEAKGATDWVTVWPGEVVRLPYADPAGRPPHDPDNNR